jgi:hypothetical protein
VLGIFLQLSFDVGVVTIFGRQLDRRFKEELRRNYFVVEKGYNSFPNHLPGTRYQKAVLVSTNIENSFFIYIYIVKTLKNERNEPIALNPSFLGNN